jgi:polysaccharide biosynthesis transport protein
VRPDEEDVLADTTSQQQRGAGLEEYLQAVRGHKLAVAGVTLAAVLLALLYAGQRDATYEAQARVLVGPTLAGSTGEAPIPVTLERERELLESLPVARQVAEMPGVDTSPEELVQNLNATFRPLTDVLNLAYTGPSPDAARDAVNGFAEAYTDQRVRAQETWFAERRAALQEQLAELDADIAQRGEELAALDGERTAVSVNATLGDAERAALLIDIDTDRANVRQARVQLEEQQREIRRSLRNLDTIERSQQPPAEVLELASTPTDPTGLSRNQLLAAGLVFGLAAGTALAFLLGRLDTSVRDRADVELALGRPVLVTVPQFPLAHRRGPSALVMLVPGPSVRIQRSREAFRRLRASLQFLSRSRASSVFLVTSAHPGEGKSVVVANLAIAAAQAGRSVVIVSGDLRRPVVEDLFGLPSGPGLAEWLHGDTEVRPFDAGHGDLAVLPSGAADRDTAELLADDRFPRLVDALRTQFDLVLIDSPPVLSTADAGIMAPFTDGVVLVVDSDRADAGSLLQVRAELDRVGGTVVGAVLNRDAASTPLFTLRRDPYEAHVRTSA